MFLRCLRRGGRLADPGPTGPRSSKDFEEMPFGTGFICRGISGGSSSTLHPVVSLTFRFVGNTGGNPGGCDTGPWRLNAFENMPCGSSLSVISAGLKLFPGGG